LAGKSENKLKCIFSASVSHAWLTSAFCHFSRSGGTTFERDLRRYARHEHGWKFDSSGVRHRGNGEFVDLEKYRDAPHRAKTMEEAEKRVFEGFGIPFREPSERQTG
jgi:DNA polymerase IV